MAIIPFIVENPDRLFQTFDVRVFNYGTDPVILQLEVSYALNSADGPSALVVYVLRTVELNAGQLFTFANIFADFDVMTGTLTTLGLEEEYNVTFNVTPDFPVFPPPFG
ncbi:hypothetical protein [Paenibacillus sp. CF384]|uniref:hypothetical protein n=1 Tax=Paenibacillus sp. CF384 TaxID=1884382 RepID=UPI000895FFBB|nr:hypothetical protein [Paenibacillus sp. CF384]SDX60758.1 hypothetical protein SAMN05518855_101733 [Paenibacillus sp. CF384]